MELNSTQKHKFLKTSFTICIELLVGYLFIFVALPINSMIQKENIENSVSPITEQTQALNIIRNKVAAKGDLIHYNRMTKKINADNILLEKMNYKESMKIINQNYLTKADFYISFMVVILVVTLFFLLL